MKKHNPTLGIPGFNYPDLYDSARLKDLLDVFDASVERHDSQLHSEFQSLPPESGRRIVTRNISDLLVRMGPYVGQFVAKLFNVSEQHQAQGAKIKDEIDTIFTYKNEVVDKLGLVFKGQDTSDWDIPSILNRFDLLIEAGFPEANQDNDPEHRVARVGARYRLVVQPLQTDCQRQRQRLRKCRSGQLKLCAPNSQHMKKRQLNLATSSACRIPPNLSAA